MGKSKVAILGVTGMIGNSLYAVLKDRCDLVLVYRSAEKLKLLDQKYGDVDQCIKYQIDLSLAYQEYVKGFYGQLHCLTIKGLLNQLASCDFIINALGIIKPYCDSDPGLAFFVNGAFPHVLAETFGSKLIQITTDCVFNGSNGAPYDESAPKLSPDIYGLSKALGEPLDALVIRCSTIGSELIGDRGLLAWLISQSGKEINGYTNHWWNGITSIELGKICLKIIQRKISPNPGVYHIFSDDIIKHDLLVQLNQRFNLNCQINPVEAPIAVDRRLRTIKNLNQQLQIPSLDKMISEL